MIADYSPYIFNIFEKPFKTCFSVLIGSSCDNFMREEALPYCLVFRWHLEEFSGWMGSTASLIYARQEWRRVVETSVESTTFVWIMAAWAPEIREQILRILRWFVMSRASLLNCLLQAPFDKLEDNTQGLLKGLLVKITTGTSWILLTDLLIPSPNREIRIKDIHHTSC